MAQTFGDRIVSLRKRKGWTQAVLAREAGIPRPTLNALEHGTRSGTRVAVEIAQKLARALGVTLDYLTGMYEESERQEVNVQSEKKPPVLEASVVA